MIKRLLPLLLLSLVASEAHAQAFVGTSDFSSSTNWAAPNNTAGGVLTFTGSTLEYTSPGTLSSERSYTYWTLGNAPSNSSWSVYVDVHLTAVPSTGIQSVNLNLMAANTAELPGTGNGQGMDQVTISIDRYYTGSTNVSGFESMFNAYTGTDYHPSSTYANNVSTDATIGIAFDAAAKTLTTFYDASGSSDGQQWTPLQSYNVGSGPGDFGMNWGTDTFTFLLMGASSDSFSVTGGQAYYDNFATTAVPEPSTYALLAGSLTLAAVILRRRLATKG